MNGISATAGSVWVAVATGMLGAVELHRASDLRVVAAFGPRRNGPATNGIKADVVDGMLWVTDSMAGAVACADPETGWLREIVIRSRLESRGTATSRGQDPRCIWGSIEGSLGSRRALAAGMSLYLRSARQSKLRPSESMLVRAPIIQDHLIFRCGTGAGILCVGTISSRPLTHSAHRSLRMRALRCWGERLRSNTFDVGRQGRRPMGVWSTVGCWF